MGQIKETFIQVKRNTIASQLVIKISKSLNNINKFIKIFDIVKKNNICVGIILLF